ncbi:MAG: tyrosine-protein phosphatase [Candidatus Saccharibacteria bacterium]|nr:tyrosine-protein phosphatase [Pseudorhodobacter sp.]
MQLPRTAAALTRRTLLAALPTSFLPMPGWAQSDRPGNWAVPVPVAGLPNLHRVTTGFYRCAQPTPEGFVAAEALGIRSVISLRQMVDDAPLAAGTRLTLHRVPMKSRYVAELEGAKIVQVMALLCASLETGPVLLHCRHGADRTGLICALYRMATQGWTRDAAIEELVSGNYGFHPVWANIPRYLRTVDVDALKLSIAA